MNTEAMSFRTSKYNPMLWIRAIYDWTLRWSEHHFSVPALCVLSFAESFFFPVPADVLLMTMGAAKPKRALYYALLTSIFSILGGIFGYMLGYFAWELVGDFFMTYVFKGNWFEIVQTRFNQSAFWTTFAAAFTPLPFKVVTVAAGVFNIAFLPFLFGAIVGRPLRFFIVGGVIYFCGAKVRHFVEKYFELFTIGFTVLLVGGFLVLKWL